jgi:hypothetical protein
VLELAGAFYNQEGGKSPGDFAIRSVDRGCGGMGAVGEAAVDAVRRVEVRDQLF